VVNAPINDPKHWRERAEEARVHAEEMFDPEARKARLRIAGDYDELARRAERRLKQAHCQAGFSFGTSTRRGTLTTTTSRDPESGAGG
jgi:hypothetical protein